MIVEFNLEGNPAVAFYALYAGLIMFKDKKVEQDKNSPDKINQAGAEAYCMLQDLKKQYPKHFEYAEEEYQRVKYNEKFLDWVISHKGYSEEDFNNLSALMKSELLTAYKIHLYED